MKLKIDAKIFQNFPDLKLGVIVIKGMNNAKRISALESLLRGICAQRHKEFENKSIEEEPLIRTWYEAYINFGANPQKNPPAIAALLKRIKDGKEIPHINSLVDLYNYFSLKYLLPIGGEDLDWLCGDLQLTYTKGGEAFRPIGDIEVKDAKEGEIAYMDKGGITCRYWNYRECERTKFTEKTVNAAIIIEDLSKMHSDKFAEILTEIQNGAIKYIGGQIETYILNEENTEVEFGIQGRPVADDAKVPKQEQAHFLVMNKMKSAPKIEKKEDAHQQLFHNSPEKNQKNENMELSDEDFAKNRIKKLLEIAVQKAYPKIMNSLAEIGHPASLEHGDYASNIAMKLSKDLGSAPREIAENIVLSFPESEDIEKVEIAGPGFINFHLSEKFLSSQKEEILTQKENFGKCDIGKSKNLVMDYSAPNIAKPLGVHHLLSTVIGQSIYNIYKNLGFNAISVNHIGDWGTQFGKLICAYKKWGDKKTLEENPIAEMLKLYVRFHDEAETSPELEDEARKEFKAFEEGDKENRKLWQWFKDESLKELQKTYDLLGGIHFDHIQGESFYEDKLEDILREGKEKGIFEKGEEGAYVVKYDDPDMPPCVVQKKDGATLYSTRDFATLKYRINEWHPIKILYMVDIAQSLYFKQLFVGATRFPWYHGEAVHVWFGRMHMKDGNMSTRKGNVILLDEVLKEAIERAEKVIEEKNSELADKENVARVVGIGAVKYNVLSQNRTTDITFDWDKMLSFEGNSAPYLQYTYARAKSILRKSEEKEAESLSQQAENSSPDPADAEEKTNSLIRLFPRYKEQIALAAEQYKPNILSNYLYELAQQFNAFYNNVPVLRATNLELRTERLKIVEAASQIIKNGLALLGIETVEEM